MFAFAFAGDDYDDDGAVARSFGKPPILDAAPAPGAASTAELDLHELLDRLPVTIAYGSVALPANGGIGSLSRREIWDVKHQLMACSDDDQILSYLGSDDLIAGVYEGGFKTWECSLDLAAHLAADSLVGRTVVELGCGSALPTVAVFTRALQNDVPITLVVQDYNEVVLQYLTVPNLLLAWCRHAAGASGASWDAEGEIDVDAVRDAFVRDLERRSITIRVLTGGWGADMAQRIGHADLVLASETIYNEASLPHFVDTVERCLAGASGGGTSNGVADGGIADGGIAEDSVALVAAKGVYFGVGGGVESFKRILPPSLGCRTVFESSAGVNRVILELRRVDAT